MAWYSNTAPFARQHALAVEDKGAALDAADLSTVHVLQLHHAELLADRLFGVGQQLDRKPHLGLELLVRGDGIARHAVDLASGAPEFVMAVAECRAFGGAAGRAVLRVEIEDQLAAAVLRESERRAAGGGKTEVGDRLSQHLRSSRNPS